jgi:hypothetical protein
MLLEERHRAPVGEDEEPFFYASEAVVVLRDLFQERCNPVSLCNNKGTQIFSLLYIFVIQEYFNLYEKTFRFRSPAALRFLGERPEVRGIPSRNPA